MACLDEATVVAFIERRLAADEAERAETHLAACTECRQLVSALARAAEPARVAVVAGSGTAAAPPPRLALAPGLVVGGRFRLERHLGEGGVGTVWAARHLVTDRHVALKFLKGMAQVTPSERRRFAREARAANLVDHPNVVTVHDIFELDDGAPVLVMDLLSGESLRERLGAAGALGVEPTARILARVAAAVGAAHERGIVHRDLKPDNIFLCCGPGGEDVVKVLDFGIAKLLPLGEGAGDAGTVTRTGDMLGTPFYMSPEQLFGEADIDRRADLWALGVILYECLSGQRPFGGVNAGQITKAVTTTRPRPLDELVPTLHPELGRLAERLLKVDRAERPADMRAVQAILERHATGTAAPSVARPRRTARALGLGGAALLLVAVGAWRAYLHGRPPAAERAPLPLPALASTPDSSLPAARAVLGEHAPATQPESSSRVKSLRQSPGARGARRAAAGDLPSTLPAASDTRRLPTRLPGGVVEKVPF